MRLSFLRPLLSLRLSLFRVVVAIAALAGCEAYEVARAAMAAARTAPAGKPLPADGSTALAEQDTALQNAWFERNVIQAYRKVGHRNAKWDAAVEALLRESAPSLLGLAPEGTSDLRAWARGVLDAGCDDPSATPRIRSRRPTRGRARRKWRTG